MTRDRKRIVDESDPAAEYLLVAKGSEIDLGQCLKEGLDVAAYLASTDEPKAAPEVPAPPVPNPKEPASHPHRHRPATTKD